MIFALGVVVFIAILVFSVAWHELGHLIPAKAFGIKVAQYMVGFGPTIWSKKFGDTEYGIKWILLGGYIRMAGQYSPHRSRRAAKTGWRASMADEARSVSREEMEGTPPSKAFYRLSAPRKVVVMLGGPTMNLILALILLGISGSVLGSYSTTTTVAKVSECVSADGAAVGTCTPEDIQGPAAAAGVQEGDRITAWNGKAVSSWDDVTSAIKAEGDKPGTVTVDRDGQSLDLSITPTMVKSADGSLRPLAGITSQIGLVKDPIWKAPVVLWQQVEASAKVYVSLPVAVWKTMTDMIEGNDRDMNSPLSMVGVARISGEIGSTDVGNSDVSQWRLRWSTWLQLGASVNIALWMFNLLPLLPLDGGHVVNALFEGIRRTIARVRRKPDPGPADSARMMPVTYVVVGLLILMTVILVAADVFNPVQI